MAAQLGWTVIVADSRSQLANAERFSDASQLVVLHAAEIASLQIQTTDAIVLMTHSYEQDRALLEQILPIAPRYFGLLGARHRTSLLVSEVAAALGWTLSQCAERLHAPVGLDLGGDAPEAVALAILAEAHAVCHGRSAASRRISAEALAESMPTAVQAAELRAVCPADFAPQSK
jgi:xanthine/CO dehydrogenase XdhC/CoxF family maturation factor